MALGLYAEEGWSGFNFEAVARAAGVGKPAVYRRWESAEKLLIEAFVTYLPFPTAEDCGSLRADLLDYGLKFVDWYRGPYFAKIALRLRLDRTINPNLSQLYDDYVYKPRRNAARQISERAQLRGDITEATNPLVLVELLLGALNIHWTYTSEANLEKLMHTFPAYAEEVVGIILGGVHPAETDADLTGEDS